MSPRSGDRWAAVDVGSDTVHLLLGRIRRTDDGLGVRHLDRRVRLLELGRNVAQTGRVGEDAANELVAAVTRYVRVAEREQAHLLVAATDALRRARDGAAVIARLESETQVPVRLLSPRREAQLGFLAARPALEPRYQQLVVDSGGGSTEVSVTAGRTLEKSASLPVGAAALAASLPGDPPSALEWAMEAVRIGGLLSALPAARPIQAILTGGTAHTIAGLESVRGEAPQVRLTFADFDRLSDELLRTATRKIARRTGEDQRRIALLAPGSLILAAILQHYGLERCVVIPQGLRDGMIVAASLQGDSWWQDGAGLPAEGSGPAIEGSGLADEGSGPAVELLEPAADGAASRSRPARADRVVLAGEAADGALDGSAGTDGSAPIADLERDGGPARRRGRAGGRAGGPHAVVPPGDGISRGDGSRAGMDSAWDDAG